MIVSLPYLQSTNPPDILSLNVNLAPSTSLAITAGISIIVIALAMKEVSK